MKNKNELKIAIVHDYLTKIGGAEKVLLQIHKIFPKAPIYTLLYDKAGTKGLFSSNEFKIIPSKLQNLPAFIRKRNKLLLPRLAQAIESLELSDYDIVISSSNAFAHGVITRPATFHICYCYSPMRFIWDWHHQYLAENNIGMGLIGIGIRKLLSSIRIWDRAAADRVDQWVAISETVKARINKYYRKDAVVINSPADIKNIKFSGRKPEDFYLIVSRLSPYKKIDLAIKAFNNLKKKLVIVGEGADSARLKSIAKDNIVFLGWQSDQKVWELYSQAKAFVFPGEEDFGLTPIESMAAGRPVIAFRKGGVTETVIDGKTGVFFDEPTPNSLQNAVKKMEAEYAKFDPSACREQAEKFSCEKFGEALEQAVIEGYDNYIRSMNSL